MSFYIIFFGLKIVKRALRYLPTTSLLHLKNTITVLTLHYSSKNNSTTLLTIINCSHKYKEHGHSQIHCKSIFTL